MTTQNSNPSSARTVLLIEDNPTDIFVITQVLKKHGWEQGLRVVTDGATALQLWQDLSHDETNPGPSCPTLVLLDLNIPKVTGREVLSRIRRGSHCVAVPVVVVSSSDSAEDLAAIQALNASAYFRKPIDLAAFMELGTIIAAVVPELRYDAL